MKKYKHQRVAVFVDVQNMYHSAKNLYHDNVNFAEVLKTATAGRQLIRAIAYTTRSENQTENSFFEALDKQGFEVKMKDLQIFVDGSKKGDWDVGITVDTIKLADKIDSIILVTGDGDYHPLVKYLQENKGCQVELVSFKETTSSKLIEIADDYFDLSSNLEKYLLNYKARKKRKSSRSSKKKKRSTSNQKRSSRNNKRSSKKR